MKPKNPYSVHPGILRMGAPGDAERYLKEAPGYVEAMFSGKKAGLRPIYEELFRVATGLGADVTVSPGKTIIPFYRSHVFAQVKPTTQTRVDLGLCLRGVQPTGRLVRTGGEAKGDRITHRIGLTSVTEIDREVLDWLKRAYEADVTQP